MDNLPTEVLIRILDKSHLSDQLVSHRLINTKFRELIPTKASRIQRIDTTDLVAVSKKWALFSQMDCAYYQSRKYLFEEPELERAYANLLLYFCHLSGTSLRCISFTAPLFLDSATMEKVAMMCPNVIEIKVGNFDFRVRYLGGGVRILFNYVYLALPRFPQLKILRIMSDGDTDTRLLEPIIARLRLQKLRTSGRNAPIFTADPNLLEELVIPAWLNSGQYRIIQNRICEVFPNLRRHYWGKKQLGAIIRVRRGTAEENYRRLHMLRGSSWIGGNLSYNDGNLWFIDERLFRDFPYLQSMNIEISDHETCDIFIRALQSSTNWKALNIEVGHISNRKGIQLLQALFYTTAVRLKSLLLSAHFEPLDHGFKELFLHFDQAGSMVVFDKTLRKCKMAGSGMLLFVAKVASACRRLKSLSVTDSAEYTEAESGLQELVATALARFQQADLSSLLKLSLEIAPSYIIQCLRGSRLHTVHLGFVGTDHEMWAAHCSSLLREDMFPYLRKIDIIIHSDSILSDLMLNILRNLPSLQWLKIVLYGSSDDYYVVPTVQFDQSVWQHIADHANLQTCCVILRGCMCSDDTYANLYNAIIARKKVDENGRVLPWLYTRYEDGSRKMDDQHHTGENGYCILSV